MSACGCGTQLNLPVPVIGVGPVGLAGASHLLIRGESVPVFETGDDIGANIRQWQHIRMLSPWQSNIDKAAKQLLEHHDWGAPPNEELPTGQSLLKKYFLPLSNLPEINSTIHVNAKVIGVARNNLDKLKTAGRVGDFKAAAEVHLELPETGVCTVGVPSVQSCCG